MATLSCENGNYSLPRSGTRQVTADQATAGAGQVRQVTADTTATGVVIDTSGMVATGWVKLVNLDEATTVQWGITDGANFRKVGHMLPGEPALWRLALDSSWDLAVKVASGTAEVQVIPLEA